MSEKSETLHKLSDILAECDLFRGFAHAEISSAARYFNFLEIEKGGAIFHEGDAGAFMCIVNSGKISVMKTNQDGEIIEIATLQEGRTFGEMAVLDGERRSATCLAATECNLLTLSKDSMDRMLLDVPATAAKVVRAVAVSLSKRLRMADGKLVDRRSNCAY
jgi:CRP/FNR family cyclic AMP-dependent transcriptional regulator